MRSCLFIILTIWSFFQWAQAASVIQLQGDPRDMIYSGQSAELAGPFTVTPTAQGLSIKGNGYTFAFEPPQGESFKRGAYLNAELIGSTGPMVAGLNVKYSMKECLKASGEIFIYDLDLTRSPPLVALDFKQHCNYAEAALQGQIRIESDHEIPYSLPMAVAVPSNTIVYEDEKVVLDASRSFSYKGDITAYQWEQINGLPMTLDDPTSMTTAAWAPSHLPLGGEDAKFRLTITNSLGKTSSTVFAVKMASKSDPETHFNFISEGTDDRIGIGRTWQYNQTNSKTSLARNAANGVGIDLQAATVWGLQFAAPNQERLNKGSFANVIQYPTELVDRPSLDVHAGVRHCDTVYGSFIVDDVLWDTEQPIAYKGSFTQRCDAEAAPALSGEFTVNTVSDSVPIAKISAATTLAEKIYLTLDGSGSFDKQGDALSYEWRIDADDIVLTSSSSATSGFFAPTLEDGVASRPVTITLKVTDSEGYQAATTQTIIIQSSNQSPQTQTDVYKMALGAALTLKPLENDLDSDGEMQTYTVKVVTPPKQGELVMQAGGAMRYTHNGQSYDADYFEYTVEDNDGAVSAPTRVDLLVIQDLHLKLRAYLQGAYDTSAGLMRDSLRGRGLLPVNQPYTDPPFEYLGTERLMSIALSMSDADAPVDWLLLELRSAQDPSQVTYRQALIVQRDGDIVSGQSYSSELVFKGLPAGAYYIALQHRNHLGVMTAKPIALGGDLTTVDFTLPETPVYGTNSRLLDSKGHAFLWAGDSDGDHSIVVSGPNNDMRTLLRAVLSDPANTDFNTNFIYSGYDITDLNLDGYTIYVGTGNDVKLLLGNILGHPDNTSFATNFVVKGQLPQGPHLLQAE